MNTKTMEAGSELALAPSRDLEAAFGSAETVDGIVAKIAKAAKAQAAELDTTTPTGRAAIKSVAHTVAKSKTALDAKGKELNDERRAAINVVDAGRRKIREELDALRDEIRKPVTEWENAEEKRVADLKARLAEIAVGHITFESSTANIEGYADVIARIKIDTTWQEYMAEASDKKEAVLVVLADYLDAAKKREAVELELEQRRAADLERDRLDAYEDAQSQADDDNAAFDQAKADADERERKRLEQVEIDQKAAVDKAAADATAEAERVAEHKRISEQAERDAATERQNARDRDEKRRTDAHADIMKAIAGLRRSEVVDAIMNGDIPHVKLIL
jgi:hypothetical protein